MASAMTVQGKNKPSPRQAHSIGGGRSLSTPEPLQASDGAVSASKPSLRSASAAVFGLAPVEQKSLPLHQTEAVLVAITALHLCFLPWALGTVHVWSQFVSLALSAIGFAIALRPRQETGKTAKDKPSGRLIRWPFFWAGLIILTYIALQGANPEWRFVMDKASWTLLPLPHEANMPTSVEAPFARSNPWRGILVVGSVWLLLCSIRIGFTRRLSFRAIFAALAINGGLLALLGMAEQVSGTQRIFWAYLPSNPQFASSFIYRNHAGAYFDLMVAVAGGLAWWHLRLSLIHI